MEILTENVDGSDMKDSEMTYIWETEVKDDSHVGEYE